MASAKNRRLAATLFGILSVAATACGTATMPVAYSSNPVMTGASFGGTPTAHHRYGLKFTAKSRKLRFSTSRDLPANVDLRPEFSPIADQGQLGSCTAFAWGKGVAEYLARKHGDKTALSPLFFYVEELKMEGHLGQDAGAESMETGAKTLNQFGIAPETDMPYLTPAEQMNPNKVKKALSTLPSEKALKDAAPFKSHDSIAVAALAAAKAQLAAGNPVAMGIMVYESFESPAASHTGMIPIPDTNKEQLLGGHAVVAVGYDDAKQVLIMRNSWGTSWGDKGWFYLPYGFIKSDLVLDCWSAK